MLIVCLVHINDPIGWIRSRFTSNDIHILDDEINGELIPLISFPCLLSVGTRISKAPPLRMSLYRSRGHLHLIKPAIFADLSTNSDQGIQ